MIGEQAGALDEPVYRRLSRTIDPRTHGCRAWVVSHGAGPRAAVVLAAGWHARWAPWPGLAPSVSGLAQGMAPLWPVPHAKR